MYMRWNLGVSFGYRGLSKKMVEGVGEIPWLLFSPFLKYLTRFMLQTSYMDENHHFLAYSAKKSCENSMFLRFLAKKMIFANFHAYFQCIQMSEGVLILWRHSDVIWNSMVLILVSMDREYPYLYTGSKHRVSGVPYRKSREADVLQKNTSGGQGLTLV